MSTVTLLTDFGLEDEYVGVMKGVILSANPQAQVVDLCHSMAPGDVQKAVWILRDLAAEPRLMAISSRSRLPMTIKSLPLPTAL